ncbi:MAG: BON domain-containing protein [Candidatus Lokiarchaeota archaeon]|nr:BON domain-containing protein [Candidatus Lokiarchaeota archaeon]
MSTDELIKKQVVETLAWDDSVDASDIEVKVNNGKVQLSGVVPTYKTKIDAVTDSWVVEGVESIENLLRVEYPPGIELPNDDELKEKIEKKLEWYPKINASEIEVSVKDGTVTLEGVVDAIWKSTRTEDLCEDIIGVLDVKNKLIITPEEKVSDETIAENIVNALDRNLYVNIDSIDVKVENGIVTLLGNVKNWTEYNSALNIAERTFGVIDIKDKLAIKY